MKSLALFLLLAANAAAHAQSVAMRTQPCTQSNVSVAFDDANGRFNGKTESGGLLVIRNFGDQPCTVLPRPAFRFEDKDSNPLDLTWAAPRFMHPGPVMIPIIIPPGAEVTGHMQWVSSPSDLSLSCVRSAIMEVKLDGDTGPRIPFGHDLCGKTFTLEPLHPDPVYTGPK